MCRDVRVRAGALLQQAGDRVRVRVRVRVRG
jgi:hypothetical protein